VTDTSSYTVRVINCRNQPVELHCGHRVVVLQPQAAAVLTDAEQASPVVQALVRQRHLVLRPLPAPPQPTAPKPAAKKPTGKKFGKKVLPKKKSPAKKPSSKGGKEK